MIQNPRRSNRIARHAGYQGARSRVHGQALAIEKLATDQNNKPKKTPLIRSKVLFRLSTFNVRTLNNESQISELIASAIEYKIDVICLQEHRFFHDDSLKYHDVPSGWALVTASCWKNSSNSSIGGVGLLLSPTAKASLISIEKISPRIIIATFSGNPKSTLISCYSPTNVSEESEVSEFYDELSSLVRAVPKHSFMVIGGDFNAQLGTSAEIQHTYHTQNNRNGDYFEQFLIQNNLSCLNTRFQKKDGKKWSFSYPNGAKALLDHIVLNKKWINSAINCESYNTFEGVFSDHRIVTAKLRLSLRANKKKKSQAPCYDWKEFSRNAELQNQYSISLRNRFDILRDNTNNVNETYQAFISAHEKSSDIVPTRPKQKHRVPWENDKVKSKREQLKKIAQERNRNPSRLNLRRYVSARKDLEQTYSEEQQKYIQKQIDNVKDAADNQQSSKAWQIVNEISGRKRSSGSKLKANNQGERLLKWENHFKNLLGTLPAINDQPIQRVIQHELPIKKGPFSMDEIDKALQSTKNGKAAGLDTIPPEVWKTGKFNDILLQFCNEVYNSNPIDFWRKGCILPFPKKGDLSLPENYRGITLTCIAAKIYNSMLRNRILPELDRILRPNQNGFRPNRSTTGQILTVRRIFEGVKARNLKASIIFVDFSKAFDSVHRVKLKDILLSYGIPTETVTAIMMLYHNTEAMVRSPDGDTGFFEILAGVLQGDTLAPLLFIITLDYVLRKSLDIHKDLGFTLHKARSRRYPPIKITDADYADDLALFADEFRNAEILLHSLEEIASIIGLRVNAKKTEVVNHNQDGIITTANNIPLKGVSNFTYLGSEIASTAKDIDIRIAKAWKAVDRLTRIWKSNLPNNLKREFFRAVVEPILLYGSTTWTLLKNQTRKLDGTYTRMLRAILNKSWTDHPTKEELYGNIPAVSETIMERRMKFAGHCFRSKDELISSLLLWKPMHGHTSRGRPCKTYVDLLCEDTGLNAQELQAAMMDRDIWRQRIRVARARRPIR